MIYHVEWQSLCGSGEKMGSYGTLRLKEVRKISRGGNQVPVVAVVVCHVTLLSGRNRSIVGDFHGWRRLPTAVHLGPWQRERPLAGREQGMASPVLETRLFLCFLDVVKSRWVTRRCSLLDGAPPPIE